MAIDICRSSTNFGCNSALVSLPVRVAVVLVAAMVVLVAAAVAVVVKSQQALLAPYKCLKIAKRLKVTHLKYASCPLCHRYVHDEELCTVFICILQALQLNANESTSARASLAQLVHLA